MFDTTHVVNEVSQLDTTVESPRLVSYVIKKVSALVDKASYWDCYKIAETILLKFLPPQTYYQQSEWYIAFFKTLFSFVL